jgi:hypothetical protein
MEIEDKSICSTKEGEGIRRNAFSSFCPVFKTHRPLTSLIMSCASYYKLLRLVLYIVRNIGRKASNRLGVLHSMQTG